MKKQRGITLIALVITIIVLLILAGISIATLTGENGILTKANQANEEYKISKAREELITALAGAHIEKTTNKEYNQDEFLDNLIEKEVETAKVKEDLVINDGYAFDLDRSDPKLGEYRGKEKDLVFPEVKAEVKIQPNNTEAIIKITAKEEKNGISKIEIWQEGYIIKEYHYEEKRKDEITENYTVKQNGTYIIKVYAELKENTWAEVEGLVSKVEYEPNGNNNWKKEHSVKINVNENIEKVKSIKYQWLQTTAEPAEETFTQSCTNGETLTKNGVTGKWYVWTLLETESGKKTIGRSESFWFDNEEPKSVTLKTTPTSAKSFKLTATATDNNKSGIAKYEFYVNNQYKGAVTTTEQTADYNVTGIAIGENYNCYVIVRDTLGNTSAKKTVTARTQMYTWEKWSITQTNTYTLSPKNTTMSWKNDEYLTVYKDYNFDNKNGVICGVDQYETSAAPVETVAGAMRNPYQKYWIINEKEMVYFNENTRTSEGVSYKGNLRYIRNVIHYTVQTKIVTSKGPTQYANVTSTSSSAYPNNKESGSYWYVYKGLQ